MKSTTAIASGLVVAVFVTPLHAEVDVGGSVQLRQVVTDTSNSFRGTTGYLEASGTTIATVRTNRLNGNVNATVARRFEEFGDLDRNYRVGGAAAFDAGIVEDTIFLGFGGQARQTDRDQRGFAGQDVDAANGNQVQVFSVYAEPRLQQRLGGDYSVDASYRVGLTTVDGIDGDARTRQGDLGLDGRGATARGLSDSLSQVARLSIGSTPRQHRLGIRAIGSWTDENIDELDQRYRAYSASLQGNYRVSRKLLLTLEGGYEDILNTQDSILYDEVTGLPVLGPDGDFVPDPANPRRTAFERSGAFGVGGFTYTPNRRTTVGFSGGYRYGDPNFNAFLSLQPTPRLTVTGSYNEGISSFSRLLTQSFNDVIFGVQRVGNLTDVPLCIDGFDPVTGDCLSGFTQSVIPATFRNRTGTVGVQYAKDRLSAGGSLFYNQRNYVDLQQLQTAFDPDVTDEFTGDDTSFGIRGNAAWALPDSQTVGVAASLSRNDYALVNDRQDTIFTATAYYTRDLGQSIFVSGRGAASFRRAEGDFAGNSETFSGSVGIGYRF